MDPLIPLGLESLALGLGVLCLDWEFSGWTGNSVSGLGSNGGQQADDQKSDASVYS